MNKLTALVGVIAIGIGGYFAGKNQEAIMEYGKGIMTNDLAADLQNHKDILKYQIPEGYQTGTISNEENGWEAKIKGPIYLSATEASIKNNSNHAIFKSAYLNVLTIDDMQKDPNILVGAMNCSITEGFKNLIKPLMPPHVTEGLKDPKLKDNFILLGNKDCYVWIVNYPNGKDDFQSRTDIRDKETIRKLANNLKIKYGLEELVQ